MGRLSGFRGCEDRVCFSCREVKGYAFSAGKMKSTRQGVREQGAGWRSTNNHARNVVHNASTPSRGTQHRRGSHPEHTVVVAV